MISWIERSGLEWQSTPMNDSQRQEIKELLKKRLKLFYLLIPSLFIVCFEAFGGVFGKIKRSLTHEYGTIQDFGLYYLLICFMIYLALCFIIYRVSIFPVHKDYRKGMLITYKAQVIGKQYFDLAGKCFLQLAALPPHNKTEVTAAHYEQTEIGDWITLSVAPNTAYFFDYFGKYYLL